MRLIFSRNSIAESNRYNCCFLSAPIYLSLETMMTLNAGQSTTTQYASLQISKLLTVKERKTINGDNRTHGFQYV
jgi:hypothetical protein